MDLEDLMEEDVAILVETVDVVDLVGVQMAPDLVDQMTKATSMAQVVVEEDLDKAIGAEEDLVGQITDLMVLVGHSMMDLEIKDLMMGLVDQDSIMDLIIAEISIMGLVIKVLMMGLVDQDSTMDLVTVGSMMDQGTLEIGSLMGLVDRDSTIWAIDLMDLVGHSVMDQATKDSTMDLVVLTMDLIIKGSMMDLVLAMAPITKDLITKDLVVQDLTMVLVGLGSIITGKVVDLVSMMVQDLIMDLVGQVINVSMMDQVVLACLGSMTGLV
jgi:hypothetical protein